MSQFFKFIFASCLGILMASVVLFFLGVAIIGGLASQAEEPVTVRPNSVLKITLEQPLPERTNNLEMNPFDLQNQKIFGLSDIEKALEAAAKDDDIKGILLDFEYVQTGLATASTLRDALLEFKESGKFVVAHSKFYSQGAYYLASAADKIYLNPLGNVDFHGMSASVSYFKEMLDNIGVKMQVYYAGDFKSATEPFRRYDMSAENRLQWRQFLEPVYTQYLQDIGDSRNKSAVELRVLAEELKVRKAEDALTYGLVDATAYLDEVIADLRMRLGLESDDKLNTISLTDYATTAISKKDYSVKDKIAVVYAEGSIITGEGEPGQIGDDKYMKILRDIRKDDRIKAIVLRVNSPGGSPIASENILRELALAKEAGKKVVVSMGDYAASGGYYIACNADQIIAETNTLTGSIGVFLMLPNTRELMTEKIGLSMDTVKTTKYSTGLNTFYAPHGEEHKYLEEMTLHMYQTFKQRVAEGRNLNPEQVEAIAQGRIWAGEKAKEIGLVDELGGLEKAVEVAADLSGLEKYRLVEYPRIKEPLELFLEELTGKEEMLKANILQQELGEYYPYYKYVKEVMQMQGPQARLPVVVKFR